MNGSVQQQKNSPVSIHSGRDDHRANGQQWQPAMPQQAGVMHQPRVSMQTSQNGVQGFVQGQAYSSYSPQGNGYSGSGPVGEDGKVKLLDTAMKLAKDEHVGDAAEQYFSQLDAEFNDCQRKNAAMYTAKLEQDWKVSEQERTKVITKEDIDNTMKKTITWGKYYGITVGEIVQRSRTDWKFRQYLYWLACRYIGNTLSMIDMRVIREFARRFGCSQMNCRNAARKQRSTLREKIKGPSLVL